MFLFSNFLSYRQRDGNTGDPHTIENTKCQNGKSRIPTIDVNNINDGHSTNVLSYIDVTLLHSLSSLPLRKFRWCGHSPRGVLRFHLAQSIVSGCGYRSHRHKVRRLSMFPSG